MRGTGFAAIGRRGGEPHTSGRTVGLDIKLYRQKHSDHRDIGSGVFRHFGAAEVRTIARGGNRQRERQHPLIRKMRAECGVALPERLYLPGKHIRDLLAAHAPLAEAGEHLAHVLMHKRRHQSVARTLLIANGGRAQLVARPTERASQCGKLAHGHGPAQSRREALGILLKHGTTRGQIKRRQAACRRTNRGFDLATPARIEPVTVQHEIDADAEPAQQWHEAAFEKLKGRCHRIVGAATQRHPAGSGREQ